MWNAGTDLLRCRCCIPAVGRRPTGCCIADRDVEPSNEQAVENSPRLVKTELPLMIHTQSHRLDSDMLSSTAVCQRVCSTAYSLYFGPLRDSSLAYQAVRLSCQQSVIQVLQTALRRRRSHTLAFCRSTQTVRPPHVYIDVWFTGVFLIEPVVLECSSPAAS